MIYLAKAQSRKERKTGRRQKAEVGADLRVRPDKAEGSRQKAEVKKSQNR
jgi:hypothetical protein